MNLVIDVGNTRLKYAFFHLGEMRIKGVGMEELFRTITDVRKEHEVHVFLSGSGKIEEDLRMRLRREAVFWLEASPGLLLPLEIGYNTPVTLGFDRIAICTAARRIYPAGRLLVIDTGTAFTYNYVENGVFLGGNISPGLEMRFRALHAFTEKLPYVEARGTCTDCGRDTEQAIRNGVVNGMVFEVKGYIDDFFRYTSEGQVVITGGSLCLLEKLQGERIHFEESLGMIGLNDILEFNKKSK